VIAPRAGGALDIVDDPATGILIDRVEAGPLAAAVSEAATRSFDPEACRASAERFSKGRFLERIERVVAEEFAAAEGPHAIPVRKARVPTPA
jgi:glycosyltransferase involved in cell wall biosynthesis